jgi:uncharacterized protein (TIGR02246 family)
MAEDFRRIAEDFVRRYELAWNGGNAADVAALYAPDGTLVARESARGHAEIQALLQGIFNQGWTGMAIRILDVRSVNGRILLATEYEASGSGPTGRRTMSARSSHVLVASNGSWLSTLHTGI